MFVSRRMKKEVFTVDSSDSLLEAKIIMRRHDVNQLPVLKGKTLEGVISKRDIQAATAPLILLGEEEEGKIREILEKTPVSALMTKNPIVANLADTLEDAVILMHEYNVNSLPVLSSSGRLSGIITKTDVLEAFIEALGVNEISQRLEVVIPDKPGALSDVVNIIKKFGSNLISIMTTPHPDAGKRIVYLRIATLNILPIKESLEKAGIEMLGPWNLP